jgi:hypothetical protein
MTLALRRTVFLDGERRRVVAATFARTHPSGVVADSLDEAKSVFRAAWEALG